MKRILISLILLGSSVSQPAAETMRALDQADLFIRHTASGPFTKCGTPRLLSLLRDSAGKPSAFASDYMLLDRPRLERSVDSAEKHFCVHYNLSGSDAPDPTDTNGNGVPDYVDSTLVYLEFAWKTIIELGYGAPKSDSGRGGSDAVDVYIMELSPQRFYGYTSPDDSYASMGSSYMVIDNNFKESVYPTQGYPALRVTTAHEFFHVVHYSYYGGEDAVWWMEQSAVWMEDYTWDDVNDYLNYLVDFLTNRDTPIDTNGPYMYSAALFAFMIAKKHGPDMIRAIWNAISDHQSGSIELFNPILPGTLSQAMLDLGIWSYFTGSRANSGAFFTDSPLIRGTVTAQDTVTAIPAVDSLSCRRYTFKYVDISPSGGFSPADSLFFEFSDRNGGVWKKQIILYNSPADFELVPLTGSEPLLLFSRPFRKAVLVIANASQGAGTYRLVYAIMKTSVNKPQPLAFSLDPNYPNPFNNETIIRFTVPKPALVRLKIVNVEGQTVRTLVDGMRERGSYAVTFTAAGLSSGVYVTVLESYGVFLTRKIAFIK